jgi:hypothetical protein
MFEDLIPSPPAAVSASPPGMFDDLIPVGGASGAAAGGMFENLIPVASSTAVLGESAPPSPPSDAGKKLETGATGAVSSIISPPPAQRVASLQFYETADGWIAPPAGMFGSEISEPAAPRGPPGYGAIWGAITDWLYRDVGKQITESTPGKFIADVTHIYDSGPTFIDPQTGTETGVDPAKHLVQPEGGRLKVHERVDKTRPIGLQDLGIVSGVTEPVEAFGKALRGDLMPTEVVPSAIGAGLLAATAGRSPAGRLPGQVTREAPRPLDSMPSSLSAAARDLPPLHEGAWIMGDGPHGPIVRGYEGRWTEAVDWMRRAQTGDALGVLEHTQVPGRIDVIWGDDRYGLAHIIANHPEIIEDFPNLLAGMRQIESAVPGRIELSDGEHTAVITRDWLGERKTWLLTAFRKRNGNHSGPGGRSGFRPATDLRSSLSRYYDEEGAGLRRGRGSLGSPPGLLGPTRSSSPPGDENVGSFAADNKFEVATAPAPLSQQQVAGNRAKVADFIARVGIPLDRVGSTEIDAVARRMGNLPTPDAIETTALRNALEGEVVSPDEVDRIYGPGAADAVRRTSTSANGPADPAQGPGPG